MGYDSSRFLDAVDEEFHCSICSMVLEDPVQTPCDHSFCNECITQWLTLNAVCPVDRQSLKTSDLKPSSRIIRNVLAKMKINCDFQQEGCISVIALDHLQNHLASCEYNPNSEIICDKGCNLRMKRREYETNNCLIHLSNRVTGQEKEIIRLSHDLTIQKEDFQRTFNRQKEDYDRALNRQIDYYHRALSVQIDDIVKLKDDVKSLQEQIGRLKFTPNQIEIKKRPLKWQHVTRMNISTDELNVLEGNNDRGFAQLSYPLDSSNSSFKVEILALNSDRYISIGLGTSEVTSNETIFYSSDGKLNGGIFKNRVVPTFVVGDIIECGFHSGNNYKYDFNIDGSYEVALYFNKNGKFILKELVKMPHDGFYPCVWLNRDDKIKFSIN